MNDQEDKIIYADLYHYIVKCIAWLPNIKDSLTHWEKMQTIHWYAKSICDLVSHMQNDNGYTSLMDFEPYEYYALTDKIETQQTEIKELKRKISRLQCKRAKNK